MKRTIQFGGQLLASLFLFYAIGVGFTFLFIQNQWLDMRFDSEFVITISLLTGLWFYFIVLFMDGQKFAIWSKQKIAFPIVLISAAIISVFTIPKNSLLIMPAYMTRKAFFLDDVVSLHTMNILILIWIFVGIISLLLIKNKPLAFENGATMNWNDFSKAKRTGIMALFGLFSFVLLIYWGQGEIQAILNQAFGTMKKADVEGFRDFLLSFGPLAAVVSALLMVFQSVLAPLPAFVITFANGLLFGWAFGAILSWSSAMVGAIVCYYLAKYLGRPVVEKIVTKKALNWWDQFFYKYGKHAVFIARLVPIVSFDLVSYAAGVTSISFWQFFWATGLGQLPATILYSYLGQNATDTVKILFFLFTIVIALTVIGILLKPKFSKFARKE